MNIKNIKSGRLILEPITLELAQSLLKGENEKLQQFGVKAAEDWPRDDTMDILPIIEEELKKNDGPTGFEAWMIIRKEDMQVIGDIGFKGAPDESGEIEVGYGLIESARNRGYATEAVQAITGWAFAQPKVIKIKAETLTGNRASARVLEKSCFKETGRDSGFIYWEIQQVN